MHRDHGDGSAPREQAAFTWPHASHILISQFLTPGKFQPQSPSDRSNINASTSALATMELHNEVDPLIAAALASLLRAESTSPNSNITASHDNPKLHAKIPLQESQSSPNDIHDVFMNLDMSWLDDLHQGASFNTHHAALPTSLPVTNSPLPSASALNSRANNSIRPEPFPPHIQQPFITTPPPHCRRSVICKRATSPALINSATALPTSPTASSDKPPISVFRIDPLLLPRLPSSFAKQALNSQDELSKYLNLKDAHHYPSSVSLEEDGYSTLVQGLLDSFGVGILVIKDRKEWTIAHYVAAYGSVAGIRVLVSAIEGLCDSGVLNVKEQVLNQVDSRRHTPLSLACKLGHADVVKLLLDVAGYRLHDPYTDPLRLSIESAHIPVVQHLLSYLESHPTIKPPQTWEAPLFTTVSCLHHPPKTTTELTNLFLDSGYSILHQDKMGCTPLIRACQIGRPMCVVRDLLVHPVNSRIVGDTGSDGEEEDGFSDGSKKKVMVAGSDETIQLATLARSDRIYGRTALHWAASTGDIETAKLLVNLGSRLEARDLRGCTPILVAAHENRNSMVKFLISMGAKTNVEDYEGRRIEGLLMSHRDGDSTTIQVMSSMLRRD
ncbi:hypothetical protein SeMB42_g00065 [Synchytrium endobioticum]|uniref:Uncharacterized protein n=1 Tax=Synchytrium endobioticum TaxID=286115 RepID=A0A507D387_9FUNG|nr:hypothetical protein SeLEV6574_g03534 [Synchytrium endobioticum]TPX55022.1 hypothetical protein SeMB42_g00065 [Synchytrium endobioticum]